MLLSVDLPQPTTITTDHITTPTFNSLTLMPMMMPLLNNLFAESEKEHGAKMAVLDEDHYKAAIKADSRLKFNGDEF